MAYVYMYPLALLSVYTYMYLSIVSLRVELGWSSDSTILADSECSGIVSGDSVIGRARERLRRGQPTTAGTAVRHHCQ